MSIEHVLASPGLPHDDDGPAFAEPWQADALAIVVALIEAGVFTAAEWSEALGTAISSAQAAGDPARGDTYYGHWVVALESLCVERGLALVDAVDERQAAWQRAYEQTPHGQPVELVRDEK